MTTPTSQKWVAVGPGAGVYPEIPHRRGQKSTFMGMTPRLKTVPNVPLGFPEYGKLLALVIPYSGNPNEAFGTAFSFVVIPINKCTFLLPSMGDFGGNRSAHWVKLFSVAYTNKALDSRSNRGTDSFNIYI